MIIPRCLVYAVGYSLAFFWLPLAALIALIVWVVS